MLSVESWVVVWHYITSFPCLPIIQLLSSPLLPASPAHANTQCSRLPAHPACVCKAANSAAPHFLHAQVPPLVAQKLGQNTLIDMLKKEYDPPNLTLRLFHISSGFCMLTPLSSIFGYILQVITKTGRWPRKEAISLPRTSSEIILSISNTTHTSWSKINGNCKNNMIICCDLGCYDQYSHVLTVTNTHVYTQSVFCKCTVVMGSNWN